MAPLTSTSYALLGLLSSRSATSYELAKQVRRSLRYFWPRAERNIYEEPKRLVDAGFVTATVEPLGRRTRTVYAITAKGRRALSRWLAEPSADLTVESEGLLKSFFAVDGDIASLRATLETFETQATQRLGALAAMCLETVNGEARYPERVHINALTMRLAIDMERLQAAWARWALEQVGGWEDTRSPALTWRAEAMEVFRDGAGLTALEP